MEMANMLIGCIVLVIGYCYVFYRLNKFDKDNKEGK